MRLTLTRDYADSQCTLGTLVVDGHKLQTLERPWIASTVSKGGTPGRSCVPVGKYRLVPHKSEAHGKTWALVNEALDVYHMDQPGISDRSAVLIHAANFPNELRGCIAPGMTRGERMVGSSQKAMRLIRAALPWPATHELVIWWN